MRRVVAWAIAAAILAGCGSEGVPVGGANTTSLTDTTPLAQLVREFSSAPSRLNDIQHFEEVARPPSDPERAVSVVLATVTDVERGTAQSWGDDEDNPDAGRAVPYDSPDADTKTIHVTAEVTEVLFGELPEQTIRVGLVLPSDADFERLKPEVLELGTVVLPVYRSPVFDYEDDLYGIRRDGSLLLVVDQAGALTAPFFGSDAGALLSNVPTVDRLRARLVKRRSGS